MFEYFRGWKRKAGLVTLLMASITVMGWARSHFTGDVVHWISDGKTIHTFASSIYGISWTTDRYPIVRFAPPLRRGLNWRAVPELSAYSDDHVGSLRQIDWMSFQNASGNVTQLFLGYPVLVIPLTALSIWLLLSKRRQPAMTEPSMKPAA